MKHQVIVLFPPVVFVVFLRHPQGLDISVVLITVAAVIHIGASHGTCQLQTPLVSRSPMIATTTTCMSIQFPRQHTQPSLRPRYTATPHFTVLIMIPGLTRLPILMASESMCLRQMTIKCICLPLVAATPAIVVIQQIPTIA